MSQNGKGWYEGEYLFCQVIVLQTGHHVGTCHTRDFYGMYPTVPYIG